jgi:hypothetical protein
MLCDDCLYLIQQADAVYTNGSEGTSSSDVSTSVFLASLKSKCYLCMRLRLTLGDKKWDNILHELPKTNEIVFDKSAISDPAVKVIRVRLGCKLKPVTFNEDGTAYTGKGYSYGYLQVDLLSKEFGKSGLYPSLHQTALLARHVSSTGHKRVLDLIDHWLQQCKSAITHQRCRKQVLERINYPGRLIDAAPVGKPPGTWQLVEVGDKFQLQPYLTLSHRWGSGTVKLNVETYRQMLAGSSFLDLPGTYRDAVEVTLHLGLRYLWIDSICGRELLHCYASSVAKTHQVFSRTNT